MICVKITLEVFPPNEAFPQPPNIFNPCHVQPEFILFENTMDPDQLASEEKSDQVAHFDRTYMLTSGILQVNMIKIGDRVRTGLKST